MGERDVDDIKTTRPARAYAEDTRSRAQAERERDPRYATFSDARDERATRDVRWIAQRASERDRHLPTIAFGKTASGISIRLSVSQFLSRNRNVEVEGELWGDMILRSKDQNFYRYSVHLYLCINRSGNVVRNAFVIRMTESPQ